MERFWSKVDVRGEDECWEWQACLDGKGYAAFQLNGKIRRASRVCWVLYYGLPIPPGLCLCHSCDNPACVNPNHLWLGTVKENARDCLSKKRWAWGERHGQSKITEKQVRQIRQDERCLREIGQDHGLGITAVFQIKTRLTWAHVEDRV